MLPRRSEQTGRQDAEECEGEMKYLRYLSYVLRHKWFVLIECCRLGIIWRGIVHDLSKFRPSEFFPYAEHFFGQGIGISTGRDKTGYYNSAEVGKTVFQIAWLHHQHRNPHHWQYWVQVPDARGFPTYFEMPDTYRKEMLADWRGAGRAQGKGDDVVEWYTKNKDRMRIPPATTEWIEIQLGLTPPLSSTTADSPD